MPFLPIFAGSPPAPAAAGFRSPTVLGLIGLGGGTPNLVSGTDPGTGTEGTPTLLRSSTAADTGAGPDAQSVSAAAAGAETSTAADAASLAWSSTAADSGAGTDGTPTLLAPLATVADPGTGTEGTPTLLRSSTAAETSTAADAASLAWSSTAADSGAGAEGSPTLAWSSTAADAGAGAEGTQTLTAAAASVESAAGPDGSSLLASTSGPDSGAGVDSGSIFAGLSLSSADAGAGADATVALAAALATSEAGSGLDVPTVAASPGGGETGAGADAGSVFSGLALSAVDAAVAVDSAPSLLVAASSPDSGSGPDSGSVATTTTAADPGTGADASALRLILASAESGTGTDAGSALPDVVTIGVGSADAGSGLEASVALAAALADDEAPAGFDNAWALAPPTASPYRDRQLLRLLADELRDTGEFDQVLMSGLPEDAGGTAGDLRLACLELDGWRDVDQWGDFEATELVRTVHFNLHLLVRADDPDLRDDELDRLAAVASATLDGMALGETAIASRTRLLRGKYQPAAGVERRMVVAGQFEYTVPGPGPRAVAVGPIAAGDAPPGDRQLLGLLADALRSTDEFDEVVTRGLPEDAGGTAGDLRLACLELDGWRDVDQWGDFEATELVRTVSYALHLLVRADDPELRDDELDRLAAVASATLDGMALGDVCVPGKTRLLRGKYQPAAGVERRMVVAGQFEYTVPDMA